MRADAVRHGRAANLPQRTITGPDRADAQARQQEEEKMPQFPSDAWIKALMQTVNESESYRESAKKWDEASPEQAARRVAIIPQYVQEHSFPERVFLFAKPDTQVHACFPTPE